MALSLTLLTLLLLWEQGTAASCNAKERTSTKRYSQEGAACSSQEDGNLYPEGTKEVIVNFRKPVEEKRRCAWYFSNPCPNMRWQVNLNIVRTIGCSDVVNVYDGQSGEPLKHPLTGQTDICQFDREWGNTPPIYTTGPEVVVVWTSGGEFHTSQRIHVSVKPICTAGLLGDECETLCCAHGPCNKQTSQCEYCYGGWAGPFCDIPLTLKDNWSLWLRSRTSAQSWCQTQGEVGWNLAEDAVTFYGAQAAVQRTVVTLPGGTGSQIWLPPSISLSTGSWTIEFWLYAAVHATWQTLLAYTPPASVGSTEDDKLALLVGPRGFQLRIFGQIFETLEEYSHPQWYHIAWSVDVGIVTMSHFYIKGEEVEMADAIAGTRIPVSMVGSLSLNPSSNLNFYALAETTEAVGLTEFRAWCEARNVTEIRDLKDVRLDCRVHDCHMVVDVVTPDLSYNDSNESYNDTSTGSGIHSKLMVHIALHSLPKSSAKLPDDTNAHGFRPPLKLLEDEGPMKNNGWLIMRDQGPFLAPQSVPALGNLTPIGTIVCEMQNCLDDPMAYNAGLSISSLGECDAWGGRLEASKSLLDPFGTSHSYCRSIAKITNGTNLSTPDLADADDTLWCYSNGTLSPCHLPTCKDISGINPCAQHGWYTETGTAAVCGRSRDNFGACTPPVTFTEAEEFCSSYGGRVCTVVDITNNEAGATGCNMDKTRVWTSTTCGENMVYTQAGSPWFVRNDAPRECTNISDTHPFRCCADSTGSLDQAETLVAWVRIPNPPILSHMTLFVVGDLRTTGYRVDISSYALRVTIWGDPGRDGNLNVMYLESEILLPKGDEEWHHIQLALKNVKTQLYLDGQLAGELDHDHLYSMSHNVKVQIGSDTTPIGDDSQLEEFRKWQVPFEGEISDFRIYAWALDGDDAAELFYMSDRNCPRDSEDVICSGHGKCNKFTKLCVCEEGYEGWTCGTSDLDHDISTLSVCANSGLLGFTKGKDCAQCQEGASGARCTIRQVHREDQLPMLLSDDASTPSLTYRQTTLIPSDTTNGTVLAIVKGYMITGVNELAIFRVDSNGALEYHHTVKLGAQKIYATTTKIINDMAGLVVLYSKSALSIDCSIVFPSIGYTKFVSSEIITMNVLMADISPQTDNTTGYAWIVTGEECRIDEVMILGLEGGRNITEEVPLDCIYHLEWYAGDAILAGSYRGSPRAVKSEDIDGIIKWQVLPLEMPTKGPKIASVSHIMFAPYAPMMYLTLWAPICPPLWSVSNGRCYLFVPHLMTFRGAKAYCQDRQADLMSYPPLDLSFLPTTDNTLWFNTGDDNVTSREGCPVILVPTIGTISYGDVICQAQHHFVCQTLYWNEFPSQVIVQQDESTINPQRQAAPRVEVADEYGHYSSKAITIPVSAGGVNAVSWDQTGKSYYLSFHAQTHPSKIVHIKTSPKGIIYIGETQLESSKDPFGIEQNVTSAMVMAEDFVYHTSRSSTVEILRFTTMDIYSIQPFLVDTYSDSTILTVFGAGFMDGVQCRIGNSFTNTTFVNSTTIQCLSAPKDLSSMESCGCGTSIEVTLPEKQMCTSNGLKLIHVAQPVIRALSPHQWEPANPPAKVKVLGNGFLQSNAISCKWTCDGREELEGEAFDEPRTAKLSHQLPAKWITTSEIECNPPNYTSPSHWLLEVAIDGSSFAAQTHKIQILHPTIQSIAPTLYVLFDNVSITMDVMGYAHSTMVQCGYFRYDGPLRKLAYETNVTGINSYQHSVAELGATSLSCARPDGAINLGNYHVELSMTGKDYTTQRRAITVQSPTVKSITPTIAYTFALMNIEFALNYFYSNFDDIQFRCIFTLRDTSAEDWEEVIVSVKTIQPGKIVCHVPKLPTTNSVTMWNVAVQWGGQGTARGQTEPKELTLCPRQYVRDGDACVLCPMGTEWTIGSNSIPTCTELGQLSMLWLIIPLSITTLITIIITIRWYWKQKTIRRRALAKAPGGDKITIIFTDIQSSTTLWEADPIGMAQALEIHNRTFRELIATHQGYEVKTIGDSFMIAFGSPKKALHFMKDAQHRLLEASWPESLLRLPICEAHINDTGQFVWRGLRVRMAAHYGSVEVEFQPTTRRVDYFGTTVNYAARLEGVAIGGQILISEAMKEAVMVDAEWCNLIDYQGAVTLRGIRQQQDVYNVNIIRGRAFEGQSQAEPSSDNDFLETEQHCSICFRPMKCIHGCTKEPTKGHKKSSSLITNVLSKKGSNRSGHGSMRRPSTALHSPSSRGSRLFGIMGGGESFHPLGANQGEYGVMSESLNGQSQKSLPPRPTTPNTDGHMPKHQNVTFEGLLNPFDKEDHKGSNLDGVINPLNKSKKLQPLSQSPSLDCLSGSDGSDKGMLRGKSISVHADVEMTPETTPPSRPELVNSPTTGSSVASRHELSSIRNSANNKFTTVLRRHPPSNESQAMTRFSTGTDMTEVSGFTMPWGSNPALEARNSSESGRDAENTGPTYVINNSTFSTDSSTDSNKQGYPMDAKKQLGTPSTLIQIPPPPPSPGRKPIGLQLQLRKPTGLSVDMMPRSTSGGLSVDMNPICSPRKISTVTRGDVELEMMAETKAESHFPIDHAHHDFPNYHRRRYSSVSYKLESPTTAGSYLK